MLELDHGYLQANGPQSSDIESCSGYFIRISLNSPTEQIAVKLSRKLDFHFHFGHFPGFYVIIVSKVKCHKG